MGGGGGGGGGGGQRGRVASSSLAVLTARSSIEKTKHEKIERCEQSIFPADVNPLTPVPPVTTCYEHWPLLRL